MDLIKKYDKQLIIEKKLDGEINVYRQSKMYKQNKYPVLTITNQYLGSHNWLLRKLVMMDSRRYDFITKSIENNLKIRNHKKDERLTHNDIASFICEDRILL